MTIDLRVKESYEIKLGKLGFGPIVSLIVRIALDSKTFKDIPESVLNDLIKRLEAREE